MPFNFQLLIEFFFSGVITLVSILLLFGIIDPSKAKELIDIFKSTSSGELVFIVFIGGLISYYLGTVVNALSNKIIRNSFSGYRVKMIRRKLGLLKSEKLEVKDFTKIEKERLSIIKILLPDFATKNEEDKLKELYTAARNYCGIHSESTSRMISYHWGLLRLSRATILPLILLFIVLITSILFPENRKEELFSLIVVGFALVLTIISYRYREKFLIYTVFDIFFISQKKDKNKS